MVTLAIAHGVAQLRHSKPPQIQKPTFKIEYNYNINHTSQCKNVGLSLNIPFHIKTTVSSTGAGFWMFDHQRTFEECLNLCGRGQSGRPCIRRSRAFDWPRPRGNGRGDHSNVGADFV